MAKAQGYVSRELTHFVARAKKTPEEQYDVLAEVLRSGWLATNPSAPGSPKPLDVMPGRKISRNRMYHSHAICFCDIPVKDFRIHIAKYSPFGVAFLKSFLLERGVNPVFYIANDSVLGKRVSDTGQVLDDNVTRDEFIDYLSKGIYSRFTEGAYLLQSNPNLDPAIRQFLLKYQKVDMHCVQQILAYLKPFRVTKDDADPENFYMEREWRAAADVQFALSDVCRVILPKEWEPRFKSDFPEYAGELTPAPDNIVPVVVKVPERPYDDDEIGLMMTVALARKGSAEKSSVAVRYGPMGQGFPDPLKAGEQGEEHP